MHEFGHIIEPGAKAGSGSTGGPDFIFHREKLAQSYAVDRSKDLGIDGDALKRILDRQLESAVSYITEYANHQTHPTCLLYTSPSPRDS